MKVPLERYSKVVNGFTFDENKNVLPIYVDFRNSKIIVNVSFFLSFFLSFVCGYSLIHLSRTILLLYFDSMDIK